MNAINLVSAQPWVERLGLTLLHFLWQGVLVVAVYAAARRWTVRAARPNVRYFLACAAFAVIAVAPVLTWSLLSSPAPGPLIVSFATPISAASASVQSVPARLSVGQSR